MSTKERDVEARAIERNYERSICHHRREVVNPFRPGPLIEPPTIKSANHGECIQVTRKARRFHVEIES
jgi:hypothetical protein